MTKTNVLEGLRLICTEEQECHALRGNEYAALYVMELHGEKRIYYSADSFYVRVERWSPDLWYLAGQDQRTPRQIARWLLDQGWFTRSAAYLRLIGYPDEVAA